MRERDDLKASRDVLPVSMAVVESHANGQECAPEVSGRYELRKSESNC